MGAASSLRVGSKSQDGCPWRGDVGDPAKNLAQNLLLEFLIVLLADPTQRDGLSQQGLVGPGNGSIMPFDSGAFAGILRTIDVLDFLDDFDRDQKALLIRNDPQEAGATHRLKGALGALETEQCVLAPRFEIRCPDLRVRLETTLEPLRAVAGRSLFAFDSKIIFDSVDDLVPEKLAVANRHGHRIGQLRGLVQR